MTASITDNFKSFQAQAIVDRVSNQTSGESFYIYTSHSNPIDGLVSNDLTPPTPTLTDIEFSDAYNNMLTMHRIQSSGTSRVTRRLEWDTTGQTVYSQYTTFNYDNSPILNNIDSTDTLREGNFYVTTDDDSSGARKRNVYKCLYTPASGRGVYTPSTVRPTGTSVNSFQTTDGYIWKFMYTITTSETLRFLTSSYMPTPSKVTEALTNIPPGSARRDQHNVENNTVDGELYSVTIVDRGTNLQDGTYTLSFNNTGSISANIQAIVTNGEVSYMNLLSSGRGYTPGTTVVSITHSNGNNIPLLGATGEPVFNVNIAPPGGHGFDASNELNASAATLNIRIVHPATGDETTQNDFRQIGIIRNPISRTTNRIATQSDYRLTYKLSFDTAFAGLSEDDILVENSNTSNIRLRVVGFENNGRDVYVVSVGTVAPNTNTALTPEASRAISNGDNLLIPTVIEAPQIITNSGELLYIENRKPLNRASDQVESFNITFEF